MGVERVLEFGGALMGLDSFKIFMGYMLMVFLGAPWTKFTKPLHLKWILVVYNLFCSLAALVCLIGFTTALLERPSIFEMAPSESIRTYFRLYWITKVVELMDTLFMILRHKTRQITFLHVFHHASMLVLCEYGYLFAPWAAVSVGLLINSFIHVVLYLYYGLTAVDPEITKTWKRHVTELQIAQFLIDLVYALSGYLYHGFCVYSILYGLSMLTLFSNFYHKAYLRKRPDKKE